MAKVKIQTPIESMIFELNGKRIILDSDLAAIYGVSTRRLMEQFRRNRKKFPADFAYPLTKQELRNLRSQIATRSLQSIDKPSVSGLRGGRIPVAFTEHGAIMAATILNSEEAVAMSIFVVRAFVKMREIASQTSRWMEKLREVEVSLTKRLDGHEEAIRQLFAEFEQLLVPSLPVPEKRQIGFRIGDNG